MKGYQFLKEDLEKLRGSIREIETKIRIASRTMGESCREGAETFHDNFAYEQADRDVRMWNDRLRQLRQIANNVVLVPSPNPQSDVIEIGSIVEFIDDEEKEKGLQSYRIGSYMNFDPLSGPGDFIRSISYESPLAKLLLGGRPGDTRKGVVGGRQRFLILIGVRNR